MAFSFSDNTRLFVIENSLIVEEMASHTLGLPLDIDYKKSKSLGYKSTSLSFDQKITLIQDLADNIEKTKFQFLMRIRNKFAHIKEIDSFDSFFKVLGKDVDDIKKKLIKWYGTKDNKLENVDKEFRIYFFSLIIDCIDIIRDIVSKSAIERGMQIGKEKTVKEFLDSLLIEIRELPEGEDMINKVIARLKQSK